MKIVYIYSTMSATGGTERMITERMNYLSEHYNYDITIIACFQRPEEKNIFYTSDKIKQINLGIPYFSQYKYKYPKRLWIRWGLNRLLKKSIRQLIMRIKPDILIGASRFKANYISSIKCRAKKIIECHEIKYKTINDIGVNRSFLIRILIEIRNYIYFKTIERNADLVVTLTEKDKLLWKRAKYVEVIPNFSTMPIIKYSDCSHKRVIAVGRLTGEKGFGRLIEIWKIVSLRHLDWHLDIFGEGNMYDAITYLIRINKVPNVFIHNFTSSISLEYSRSSICTVTSYFEGFSLVLLEAMRHGVPCVAFDCPFGPASIIDDASCGFLVENGETRLFAERICRLIEDEELRKDFSKAAIEKAKTFDVNIIMDKTKDLYKKLADE